MPPNVNPDDTIVLDRFTPLYLISNTPKGRGVFAGRPIPSGTIIDTCAALVLDPVENTNHIEHTSLYHYTYNWPLPPQQTSSGHGKPGGKTQAVIFGLGSMFNHSMRNQNVGWTRDLGRQLVTYRALRDIAEGEELCISYGDHLTFVDADAGTDADQAESPSEGDGGNMLDRIQLV